MTTYKELLAQREALEQQIHAARKVELADAVQKVRTLVAEYDLTQDDIFGGKQNRSIKGAIVAPKYRDPATGQTWTGRGKPPVWIRDKDREQFAIS